MRTGWRLTAVLLACALVRCGETSSPPVPMSTPAPTPLPTSTPDAAAAAFGGPILAALRDLPPQIQDDFSDGRGWIGTQGGEEPLHPEWVSVSGGFIQAVNDGSRGYTHIQNDFKTNRVVNFVVTVEASFLGDATRAGSRAIGLCWWPGDTGGERFLLKETGWFEGATCVPAGTCPAHTTGQVLPLAVGAVVSLTLVNDRARSAVYINDVPFVLHEVPGPTSWGQGFSLCPHTFDGRQSDIAYDNLRVWDLDRLGLSGR